jgi:hypothetical protein
MQNIDTATHLTYVLAVVKDKQIILDNLEILVEMSAIQEDYEVLQAIEDLCGLYRTFKILEEKRSDLSEFLEDDTSPDVQAALKCFAKACFAQTKRAPVQPRGPATLCIAASGNPGQRASKAGPQLRVVDNQASTLLPN